MCKYNVIKKVKLTDKHRVTGKTKQVIFGKKMPRPIELKIIKYLDDDGFYLVYMGEDNIEMTDTFHNNVNSAIEQAEWEFGIKVDDWEEVNRLV